MATRDLTVEFKKIRENKSNPLKEHKDPQYVIISNSIDSDITNINLEILNIKKLNAAKKMVIFDDNENENITRKLNESDVNISKLFKNINTKFNNLVVLKNNKCDEIIIKNIIEAKKIKYEKVLNELRNEKKRYKLSLEAKPSNDYIPLDNRSSNQQLQMFDLESQTYLDERTIEIEKLVKDINELNSIFKELAVIVVSQGTVLDRIDYNMETAVDHAKAGVVNLEKAEDNQKSYVAPKIIGCLSLSISVLIPILILKIKRII